MHPIQVGSIGDDIFEQDGRVGGSIAINPVVSAILARKYEFETLQNKKQKKTLVCWLLTKKITTIGVGIIVRLIDIYFKHR